MDPAELDRSSCAWIPHILQSDDTLFRCLIVGVKSVSSIFQHFLGCTSTSSCKCVVSLPPKYQHGSLCEQNGAELVCEEHKENRMTNFNDHCISSLCKNSHYAWWFGYHFFRNPLQLQSPIYSTEPKFDSKHLCPSSETKGYFLAPRTWSKGAWTGRDQQVPF